ncbi:MAG: hypothetical protein ACOX37_02805 [Bacillota bacterium]
MKCKLLVEGFFVDNVDKGVNNRKNKDRRVWKTFLAKSLSLLCILWISPRKDLSTGDEPVDIFLDTGK